MADLPNANKGAADAILAKTLEAAQAATDAAHEAEAVLAARSDAAQAMDRIVKRTTLMTVLIGSASAMVLVVGGMVWLRSVSDLRIAAQVQTEAAAADVIRLTEFNAALDQLDASLTVLTQQESALKARLDQLSDLHANQVADLKNRADDAAETSAQDASSDSITMQLEKLRADLLAAIAEAELSMAERLIQFSQTLPIAAPATVPRPSPLAAPQVTPQPKPRSPRTSLPGTANQTANPFRYP